MNTKKYIVSSLLLAALVFSFGTQVFAENGSDDSVRVNADAAVRIAPNTTLSKSCVRIDTDKNGKLNAQDFSMYEKIYASNNVAEADMDGNGNLNPNDFLAFQNTFVSCTYVRATDKAPTPSSDRVKPQVTPTEPNAVPTGTGGIKPIPSSDKDKDRATEARNNYKQRFAQLETLLSRLTKLADVIEKRISELTSKGLNVSEAKVKLASARQHLGYARNAIDTALKMYTNYGTGTVQETIKLAKKELGEARKDLISAVKALRMHDNKDDDKNNDKRSDDDKSKTLSSTCKKFDMNGDAKLTSADHVSFQEAYEKGDKRADIDLTGGLTANDFQAFMNGYVGCTS